MEMNKLPQQQDNFNLCVSTLEKLEDGMKFIESQLEITNTQMKDLIIISRDFHKLLHKKDKDSKNVKKLAIKSKPEDKELVSKLISILSSEKVFKVKFTNTDNLHRIKVALEHDMFFKTSDCNTVKIYSNNKFTHNNYLGFSTLDNFGFSKLLNRFYDACDEYKGRYINDMIHNMNILPFNYQDIEYNLTNDLSNNVSDSKLKAILNSFEAIDTEYNRVPVNTKKALSELTEIEIESYPISGDNDHVSVSFQTLNDLVPVCIKAIKDTRKKLFFSYLPYNHLKQLHNITKIIIEDFPPLKTITSKVSDVDDIYVILTADVDKMISSLKKYVKFLKNKIKEDKEINDNMLYKVIEVIYKESSGTYVVSEKKFLQQINIALERTLNLYINYINKFDEGYNKEEEEDSE